MPKIKNNKDIDDIRDNVTEQENDEKQEQEQYMCISDAIKRYNKEVDSNWMLEEEDEDSFAVDLPRTNSIGPEKNKQRSDSISKAKCSSPIRMRSNSKLEINKEKEETAEKSKKVADQPENTVSNPEPDSAANPEELKLEDEKGKTEPEINSEQKVTNNASTKLLKDSIQKA